MDVLIARQPILDRQREFNATRLIANTLLAIGLESLLRGKKALINFDRSLLPRRVALRCSPEVLVREVLETVRAG